MKRTVVAIAICGVVHSGAPLAASPGPGSVAPAMAIAAPKDRPYPGEIRVAVDASDLDRRIVHIHESLSGITPATVLLYPKWLPRVACARRPDRQARRH